MKDEIKIIQYEDGSARIDCNGDTFDAATLELAVAELVAFVRREEGSVGAPWQYQNT